MKKTMYYAKEWLSLLWFSIGDFFAAIYDEMRLELAIKLADAKQRAYNKRYFVMPDFRNKLTVLNKDDISWLKKANLMNKNVSHLEIMRDCFYYTNLSRNEEGNKLTAKERLERKDKWLSYMEGIRTKRNQAKLKRIKDKRNGKTSKRK